MKSRNLEASRWAAGAVILCLCWAPAFANFVSGTSTATQITDPGPHYLWWRYDIEISWSDGIGEGLSHWDLILKTGCALPDHLIEFDTPAGFSSPPEVGWTGSFLDGDGSLPVPDDTLPVVKYNSPFYKKVGDVWVEDGIEPGPAGSGTFSFYANIIPEYGIYDDILVTKAGGTFTYGDLGTLEEPSAYPSCTIIPEPGTMALIGLGGLGVLIRKKRNVPKGRN